MLIKIFDEWSFAVFAVLVSDIDNNLQFWIIWMNFIKHFYQDRNIEYKNRQEIN